MERRNTIQRELVLQAVRRLHTHATAEDVYAEVAREHPTVSRGTVYRNLNVLSEEGEILKVEIPGEADRYDHTAKKHYHIQCVVCRQVCDVDMDPLGDLTDRIRDTGGMELLGYELSFKGICRACRQSKKENNA